MAQFQVQPLLDTESLGVRCVACAGACRHRSAEEHVASTLLVFPYRGVYLRHVGSADAIADANHVLLFNAGEGYQVSHPRPGGDQSLVVSVAAELLRELVPAERLLPGESLRFRVSALPIDVRSQVFAAQLRHGLARGTIDAVQAECLALSLVARCVGARPLPGTRLTSGRRRLVDRAKLLLASDPARRWRLQEIADGVGSTPIYLTQSFRAVEGLPLYRYQLRLRLANALDRLADAGDLAALAQDLGFSSHSHFTAAFRQTYGPTPARFRETLRRRVG